MSKTYPVPCTKEEIDAILDASSESDFYYTLFYIAKTTGRRLGEYIGSPEYKVVGEEEYTDKHGNKKKRYKKKFTGNLIGGVQVKDIDFENKIMMTVVLKRKNHIKREALLTDEAARLLKQYITRNHLGLEDYVFRQKQKSSIQAALKRYAKKAKINHNVMFHNFRHYFVTHLTKQGWSYDKIAKLTGHTTPQTLMHYDHTVATDIKQEAMESLKDI